MEPGFYGRFRDAVDRSGLSDTKIAGIMDLAPPTISRIKNETQLSIRFDDGLAFCEELGLDPYFLAFGRQSKHAAAGIEPGAIVYGGDPSELEALIGGIVKKSLAREVGKESPSLTAPQVAKAMKSIGELRARVARLESRHGKSKGDR
jgi:hypothetical protein